MLDSLLLGALAIVLGIVFQGQNVAFMVGLAFAIAASANFPALVLSMFWRGFTTRGAQASMLVGTASALLLIYLSPTIQVGVLGRAGARFRSRIRASSRYRCRLSWASSSRSRVPNQPRPRASPRSSIAFTSGDDCQQ